MTYRAASALLSILVLVSILGCDKATPVAPDGTVLVVSANPSQVSLTGTSTITVVGRRPDGNPLNPGTEIRLSVDIGTIDSIVTADSHGTAIATYHADGRPGMAKVTAATGSGTVMATTSIQVGVASGSKPTVILSVSPNNVAVNGTATVTAIARNADGSPVAAGTTVILTTTLGTLKPASPQTKADGTATSTLNVGTQPGSATITAIVGSSDAATTTLTIRDAAAAISLQASSQTIPASGGTITFSAFVTNSQGQPLQGAAVTFQSEVGTFATTGVVFTDTTGIATNVLTVTQAQLGSRTSFMVTAQTPSGNGTLLSSTTTITVQ
ncbi:MAG TPA: Ig-like domain-containing protein [Thermoanaerobaculia bacterium]|nr:Ig-like domain-containing protein [Thermoanaerobaculia bacterium]